MLKEMGELTSRTRYKEVASLFAEDARWRALDSDPLEREELYEEYALSLERKEAAERKALRKERMGAFRALLNKSGLNPRSQWRRVQEKVEEEVAFKQLEKIDRLAVFEEAMRDVHMEEDNQRNRAKDVARRGERLARDAFRALLLSKQREGSLTARTRCV